MYQTQQVFSPVLSAQVTSPAIPGVQPAQLDISSIMNEIIPIFTLMLVFGMLMPMMKQMSGAFKRE